ncbi:MAG: 2-polyprenyl-3-methyl-5-hydroxy-6-metoxy-1,4-benzoquinol methylase [Cellvibrionaceae bacterium]|jgi:2-polyprenyl-3-methyl-5-hydroxy-6-metoxy-1,4-benzoquinol methylase
MAAATTSLVTVLKKYTGISTMSAESNELTAIRNFSWDKPKWRVAGMLMRGKVLDIGCGFGSIA